MKSLKEQAVRIVDDYSADFEAMGDEDDDLEGTHDFKIGGKVQIDLRDMDLPSWKHDLDSDQVLLDAILQSMKKIEPEDDTKLQHLMATVSGKIQNNFNEGNKKVLIFTAFADTANYLYEHLSKYVTANHELHSAKVTGSSTPKNNT